MYKATDRFGNPLNVNDPIIYSRNNNDQLQEGIVHMIQRDNFIVVVNKATGRASVNPRPGTEVINIKPLLKANPEWFL